MTLEKKWINGFFIATLAVLLLIPICLFAQEPAQEPVLDTDPLLDDPIEKVDENPPVEDPNLIEEQMDELFPTAEDTGNIEAYDPLAPIDESLLSADEVPDEALPEAQNQAEGVLDEMAVELEQEMEASQPAEDVPAIIIPPPAEAASTQLADPPPPSSIEAEAAQEATDMETQTAAEKLPMETIDDPDGRLEVLSDELNLLKEEVFRSKARTVLLQEFLINTEVQVYFKNKTRKHYDLVSALYTLDNSEIFKKEYAPGEDPKGKKDELVFTGVTTPGRHEISIALVYKGKKEGGYTDRDYEYQVTGDFSFIATRGETTVVTLTATDTGKISKDNDRKATMYLVDLDIKVESERLAKRRRKIEKRTIGIQLETGFLVESYQLVSDRLNIDQQFAGTVPFGARAWWWFHPNWGIEGYYMYAGWKVNTGVNNQSVDATLNWFGGDIKLRYKFGRSIYSPTVVIKGGYNYFGMGVSGNQSPVIVRNSDKYQYIDVGLEATFPIIWNLGFFVSGDFIPYSTMDESPVTSGTDANTKGFGVDAYFYWNFWNNFTATLGYKYFFLDNDFTGRATRTDQNGIPLTLVQSREIIQGGIFGLRYEF